MGLLPDKKAARETQARHHRHASSACGVASACGDAVGVGAMT